jgi:signal transduction histidine kinase
MPYLIDELAEALESQRGEIEEELLRGSPPAHGRQRLHDGFNVEEVVGEYNVLRGCIHDLAEEHGMVIHGSDLRVINRIIDEAIGLAVQTYATLLTLEVKKHRDLHLNFVAHDLRTPLQAIALTVGIIERTLIDSVKNEHTDQLLKILRRNIQQLEKSVVEVIKTNAGSSADATKLERREIDVWPIVEGVIRGLVPIAVPAGVELVNEIPVDLSAFADGALLTRIFENLICYSINNAPRGVVRVIGRDLGPSGIECQVTHNGPGATTEALRKMFERGAAEKTEAEGIGLGLPIVKQSIEAHEGKLEVEASMHSGVTICFRLPACSR